MTKAPVASTGPPSSETEQKLLDAALTLFAEKGYDAASVREIIAASGFTRPVLYYYCQNKEDLFKRIVAWKHEQANAGLAALVAESIGTEAKLRKIALGTFAFCCIDPRVPRLMFQTAYGPPIADLQEFLQSTGMARLGHFAVVMEQGVKEGLLAPDNPYSLAAAFSSLLDLHAAAYCKTPDPRVYLTPALAKRLVDIFLWGAARQRQAAI